MPETKQYGIIYADPPWHYDRKHGSGALRKTITPQ